MNDKETQGTTEPAPRSCAPVSGSGATWITTPNEAYDQGYGARMCGKTKAANPYLESTDLWVWFNRGWDESEP